MKMIKLFCLATVCSLIFGGLLVVLVGFLPDPSDIEWVREDCPNRSFRGAATEQGRLSSEAATAISAFVLSHPNTRDVGFGVKVLDAAGGMRYVVETK